MRDSSRYLENKRGRINTQLRLLLWFLWVTAYKRVDNVNDSIGGRDRRVALPSCALMLSERPLTVGAELTLTTSLAATNITKDPTSPFYFS
ncbi:MAG: hypothetical protein ACM3TN_28030 [Alphaproteobacteria bacterium]